MLRPIGMSVALLVAAVEPLNGETDFMRYAVTQGGLLAVVLVLLWSYRKDSMGQLKEKDEQLAVMTTLVSNATVALTRSAEAGERMARAVEAFERRR